MIRIYVIRFVQLNSLIILIVMLMMGITGCKEGAESRPTSAVNAPASRAVAGLADNTCLDCHGPFDKLIKVSANYVAPSGEKISPHRYVPHDSKLEKDIPDCSHCHTAAFAFSLAGQGFD